MSSTRTISGRNGVVLLGIGLLLVTAALFGVLRVERAHADPSTCPDGNACAWTGAVYNGDRREIDGSFGGTGWHMFSSSRSSAKNRFGARVIKFGILSAQEDECLAPNGEDPFMSVIWFKVSDTGGNC
jgi:hypothetical protein